MCLEFYMLGIIHYSITCYFLVTSAAKFTNVRSRKMWLKFYMLWYIVVEFVIVITLPPTQSMTHNTRTRSMLYQEQD